MKAKKLLLTKILLAVAMCLAIVLAFVPWSAQSAYAATTEEYYVSANTAAVANGSAITDNSLFTAKALGSSYSLKNYSNYTVTADDGNTDVSSYVLQSDTDFVKRTSHDVFEVVAKSDIKLTAYFLTQKKDFNGARPSKYTVSINGTAGSSVDCAGAKYTAYHIEQSLKANDKLVLNVTGDSGSSFSTFIFGFKAESTAVAVTGVTAENAVVPLTFDGAPGTAQLVANVLPENASNQNVTWSLKSGAEYIDLTADGKVTAKAVGTAVATVTTEEGKHTADCNVKVTDAKTLKVTYEVDGAEYLSENVLENAILDRPEAPSKDNAVFDDWYTTKTGSEKFDFTKAITANTTIYGRYHVNPTVTYETTYGTKPEAITITYDTPAATPDLKEAGYVFNGWYIGEVPYNGENITENTTLTAKWEIMSICSGTYTQVCKTITGDAATKDHVFSDNGDTITYDEKNNNIKLGASASKLYITLNLEANKDVKIVVNAHINDTSRPMSLNLVCDENKLTEINGLSKSAQLSDTATDIIYNFHTETAGLYKFVITRVKFDPNAANATGVFINKTEVTISDPAPAPVVKDVEFRATSITLGNEIGLNYCFELAEGVTADTVRATSADGEVINYAMPTTTEVIEVNGTKYTCYKVTVKVAAKMMADDITVQLYNGETAVGESYTTSVKTYAATLLTATTDDKTINLVKAMLNYGAAVQTQLGYKTDKLANKDNELTAGDITDTKYAITSSNVSGVSPKNVNVSYTSTTTIIVKLNGVAEGTEISCGDKVVKTSTVVEDGATVTVVEISGIKASEITELLTLTVGEGTLKVSVSNYCYLAQNSATVGDVAKALHAYGVAAAAYVTPAQA